ncbi:MAG: 4Fe-4S binding protein [Mogibacterium sp.]|nr:4Fe-4S binding protein [Mogibacterium sp.]
MAAKKYPNFYYKDCVSCSICVQACPVGALDLTRAGKSGRYRNLFPELVNDRCIGCGLCAGNCPMECIHMRSDYEG